METRRKRNRQKPPPGIVFADDYRSEDGSVAILGIASRLGITYPTYRKWRMAGKGPQTFMLGKRVAARIESVEAWITEQEQAALAPDIDREHESRPPEPRLPSQRTECLLAATTAA